MIQIGSFITRILSAGAASPPPWRFRIAALLLLLAMLWPLSLYLGLVLRSPQRTGLLLIGTTYSAPWDVNPWCEENLSTLEKLDKHNLSIRRVSDPSQLVFGQWAELSDDVEHLLVGTDSKQPLLVYINLHGVVSADGQPCLLVRESKPLDPTSWLPLDTLVERLRQALPHPRPLIMAIEGGRQRTTSLPYDQAHTFADATAGWYSALHNQGQAEDLFILVGSSSRFGAVQHPGQRMDLFTRCLAEALTGQCDQPEQGGNGNRCLEWDELHQFVHRLVEERSRSLRGVPQLTAHFASPNARPFLAWNTALDAQRITHQPLIEPSAEEIESISAIWKQVYALQSAAPWHDSASDWGQLKRIMVAWEQSLFGGNGVRSRTSELEKRARGFLERLSANIANRESAQTLEARMCRQAVTQWSKLASDPSLSQAQAIVQADRRNDTTQPCAVPMLIQLLQQPDASIWQMPQQLQRWATLQAQLEQVRETQVALPYIPELIQFESEVDERRRDLEDAMLVGDPQLFTTDTWDKPLDELQALVERWQATALRVQAALRISELMQARLPLACEVVDMLEGLPGPENQLTEQLDRLEAMFKVNEDGMAAAASEVHAATVPANLAVSSTAVDEFFVELAEHWQRLLFDSQAELGARVLVLEQLVNSGLLPVEVGSVDKAVQIRLATHKRLAHTQVHAVQQEPQQALSDVAFGTRNQVRMRRWLGWLNERDNQSSSEKSGDGTNQETSGWSVARVGSTAHGLHVNAAANWLDASTARWRACLGWDETLTEPISRWQRSQSELRLAYTARRVLQDFWKLPLVNGQEYFAGTARLMLSGSTASAMTDLEQALQARIKAAQAGIQLDCKCQPIWDERSMRITSCRLIEREPLLLLGAGRLEVTQPDRARRLASPVKVRLGQGQASAIYQLPTQPPEVSLARKPAVARVTFRGHEFVSQFDVHPSVGHASSGLTSGSGPASVLVQSNDRQQRARMLVLDCSASMVAAHPIEGADARVSDSRAADPVADRTIGPGNPVLPTRLDAAKWSVEKILDHWRGQSDLVGVILYGHRVAIGTKDQGKLLQTRYGSRYSFSRELEAYEDVETILPPGRFGDQEYSQVVERLQHVVPWGQTPLYLAVMQAIEALNVPANLSGNQAAWQRDVIVVSDGRNYQFNPSAEKNVSLDQVVQFAKDRGVRVHIIGFGIAPKELEQATSEFTQLAQATGGSVCMEVQTARQLWERLDALTETEWFRVRTPNGEWTQSRCGTAVELAGLTDVNSPIVVEYKQSATLIPASPQSKIRLAPSAAGRLVRAQPDMTASARVNILTPEGQASPFDIVFSRAAGQGTSGPWQVGLERRDQAVPQRPKYLWLELEPISRETTPAIGPSPVYVVCDSLWQAETTEPVLAFQTEDWSADVESARLQFWCTDQLPEPIVRFACTPARLSNQWMTADEASETTGRVRYQLQADKEGVVLVLQHSQPAEVLEVMPLVSELPAHTRVERRYCPTQCISIHRFVHPELIHQPQLDVAIYSVGRFKAQALRTRNALELRMQKNLATVPVNGLR